MPRPMHTTEVEALTADMLNKLQLPAELTSFGLRNIHYTDNFELAEDAEKDESPLLDICAEFPFLAAIILLRDTLSNIGREFLGSPEHNPDENLAYLLLRPLEQLGHAAHGIAQLAGFGSPEYMPVGFRVSAAGRLVLMACKLGRRAIREGIKNYYVNEIVESKLPGLLGKLGELTGLDTGLDKRKPVAVGTDADTKTAKELEDDQLMQELRRFSPFKPTIH